MGNWKEAERIREEMLMPKGVVIDGKYYPPIFGKGYIHDRYSCCWQATGHKLKNLSHKMKKNW